MSEMILADIEWDVEDDASQDGWGTRLAVWAVRGVLFAWCLPAIVLALAVIWAGALTCQVARWAAPGWRCLESRLVGRDVSPVGLGRQVPGSPYLVRRDRPTRISPYVVVRAGRRVR